MKTKTQEKITFSYKKAKHILEGESYNDYIEDLENLGLESLNFHINFLRKRKSA